MKKGKKTRDAVVIIRLYTEERDALKQAAEKAGLSMSGLFRKVTLTHISKSLKKT
jgi:uncharacterized protein (DUF1778 family)